MTLLRLLPLYIIHFTLYIGGTAALAQDAETGRSKLPPPDFPEVAYGPHARNTMDLWLAKTPKPAPVLIYFHGGGFRAGSKANLPAATLREALKAGITVIAANYRLTPEVTFPDFYLDSARAIQFARLNAKKFNIDPARVALTGSSAGAGTSLWIAFHPDLAQPDSPDPVLRQSTRVTCVAVSGAQPSYDPRLIKQLAGVAASKHYALTSMYGITEEEADTPKARKLYEAAAPLTYLTADDPPVFAYYSEPREIPPPDAKPGTAIHHPNLGLHLKQKMDSLKIECIFLHRDQNISVTTAQIDFLKKHLAPSK